MPAEVSADYRQAALPVGDEDVALVVHRRVKS